MNDILNNLVKEELTDKQRYLIENMQEVCEPFDLSYPRTKSEARDYISRNLEEYKNSFYDNNSWVLENGY